MRALALVLAVAVALPAGADEKLERPATPTRRAAQVLGVASLTLVAAGSLSFGVALSRYKTLSEGCGATATCSDDQLAGGRVAQDVGWALLGAGLATGVATLILAWVDARRRPAVALVPSPGGLALAGRF